MTPANSFQIHGVDVDGVVVMRSASPEQSYWSSSRPCRHASSALRRVRAHIIGAASSERSATPREAAAAELVKAYVKRSKNDANDAAAICEAVTRPSMRFVPTKSEEQ
jgi:transposase